MMASRQKGFTVIEALVSVAVFVVVVSMGAVLFISVSGAQRKAVNQEKLVRDVRQTMEGISRLARMYPVSYTNYIDEGIDLGEGSDILYLQAGVGDVVSFEEVDGQVIYTADGVATAVTSEEIRVDNLYFYITPTDSAETDNPQRVTLVMEASRDDRAGSSDVLKAETSVTARWYGGGGVVEAP